MELMTKQRRNTLVEEIAGLRGDIKALKREREAVSEELDLSDEVVSLKRQISQLEIDEAKLTEKHARDRREVEHQVGLQRKRQDFEIDAAKRDTELKVREENLKTERERFNRDMDFQREELKNQIGYLKDLMEKLFERLPSASMTLKGALVSANGGRGRDDDDN
jgi:chromosome segregation ATPase